MFLLVLNLRRLAEAKYYLNAVVEGGRGDTEGRHPSTFFYLRFSSLHLLCPK